MTTLNISHKSVADNKNTFFRNNRILIGNNVPTSGTYVKGDIVVNVNTDNNQRCMWICTESGTPGSWSVIGTAFMSTEARMVVTNPVAEVPITGLGGIVEHGDKLDVYLNSIHLLEGEDYIISDDGTKIKKVSGLWNTTSEDAVFDFVLLKRVEQVENDNIIIKGRETKTASVVTKAKVNGPQTEVIIPEIGFNPAKDSLLVFKNGLIMIDGVDYQISNNRIVSLTGAWNTANDNDFEMTFVLLKEIVVYQGGDENSSSGINNANLNYPLYVPQVFKNIELVNSLATGGSGPYQISYEFSGRVLSSIEDAYLVRVVLDTGASMFFIGEYAGDMNDDVSQRGVYFEGLTDFDTNDSLTAIMYSNTVLNKNDKTSGVFSKDRNLLVLMSGKDYSALSLAKLSLIAVPKDEFDIDLFRSMDKLAKINYFVSFFEEETQIDDDFFKTYRFVTQDMLNNIGDINYLSTYKNTSLVDAINGLDVWITYILTDTIGNTQILPTESKSIVGAIDELDGNMKTLANNITEELIGIVSDISLVDTEVGNLSTLKTSNKANLVNAINELFQNANNGKELIANAIGEPVSADDTFSAMSDDINNLLSTFKTNMMNNGVAVESGDRFKALIDKIATMAEDNNKGIRFAEGSGDWDIFLGGTTVIDTNLDFTPDILICLIPTVNYIQNSSQQSYFTNVFLSNETKFIHTDSVADSGYYLDIANITQDSFTIRSIITQSGVNSTGYKGKCVKWYAIGVGEEGSGNGIQFISKEEINQKSYEAPIGDFINNYTLTMTIDHDLGFVPEYIFLEVSNVSSNIYSGGLGYPYRPLIGSNIVVSNLNKTKVNANDMSEGNYNRYIEIEINNITDSTFDVVVYLSSPNMGSYDISITSPRWHTIGAGENNNEVKQNDAGIKDIFSGSSNTFILKNDNTLLACGNNQSGELGLNDKISRNMLTEITDDVKYVDSTSSSTFILKNDGTLWVTGSNTYGQFGLGNTTSLTILAQSNTNVKKVSAGTNHAAVLKDDGTLWVAGFNNNGQLGLGDNDNRNTWTQITSLTNVKNVACGANSTYVVMNDGTLYSTGHNNQGQLGLGNTTNINVFTQVPNVPKNIKQIAAGMYHVLALTDNGDLWVCGDNSNGRIGLGDSADISTFSMLMSNVKYVSCGSQDSAIVKKDNTLWACGYNYSGQNGFGDKKEVKTFTQVTINVSNDVEKVECGGDSNKILKTDGTVWVCGDSDQGQLGLGSFDKEDKYTYVQLDQLNVLESELQNTNNKNEDDANALYDILSTKDYGVGNVDLSALIKFLNFGPLSNSNIKQVACGTFTTVALKTDGTVWVAGTNASYNNLGISSMAGSDILTFTQIPDMNNVSKIACCDYSTFILKNDGTLLAIGQNTYGQLGTGDKTNKNEFVQVATNVKDVQCGIDHTFIIKNDGTLWSTGDNDRGILGFEDGADRTSFEQVTTNVSQVACGDSFALILKTDGTVWGVGSNMEAQLGLGESNSSYNTFQQITTNVSNVKQIACGSSHSALLRNDGTLFVCGEDMNGSGQLGMGDTTNLYVKTFTQVATGVSKVSCDRKNNFTMILKTDGSVWVTGKSSNGQLGLGSTTKVYEFTNTGITDAIDVIAGMNNSFIITNNGSLLSGLNTRGQLGLGDKTNRSSFVKII